MFQSLNLVPGINFTNSDPYGSSGGNVRLRGFDGNRISLTQDGIPLNDTGNYAIFTNQQIDPEYIQRATVNTGTTDVDSPTASATGGTVNVVTRKPFEETTLSVGGSVGSFDYRRLIGVIDSGESKNGVSAFAGVSFQQYDKFKGPGELQKLQGQRPHLPGNWRRQLRQRHRPLQRKPQQLLSQPIAGEHCHVW
ncbi:MAG: TonB-dependent receptor plug domain-containing protein [Rhodobacteraceae bacterium]|nr:TonB-dependent receptor plug domain-containing protein [Paracoccaceae bacterium]